MPIRSAAIDTHHNIKFNKKSSRYQKIGAALALIAAALGCAASFATGAVVILAPIALIAALISGFCLYKTGALSKLYAKKLKDHTQHPERVRSKHGKGLAHTADSQDAQNSIKINKKNGIWDKAGAVTTVAAAAFGCAAALALPFAPILAPIALVMAIISAACWYKTGSLARNYANQLKKQQLNELKNDPEHAADEPNTHKDIAPQKQKKSTPPKDVTRNIKFNKKSSILNKVAAVAAVTAAALGCAAAFATGAVAILAPIALVAAVISGICWYKAGAISKKYAKETKTDMDRHNKDEENSRKKERIRGFSRKTPQPQAHWAADILHQRAHAKAHPHTH